MSGPDVSVILPAYNASQYLDAAIQSIRDQTFKNFELIIVDDGSTDNTLDMARSHAASDPRIIVVSQPNGRLPAALNRAITEASAPLLARMDGDDIALPERLAAQVKFMQRNPNVVALGTNIMTLDENGVEGKVGKYWPSAKTPKSRKRTLSCALAHPTVMMRRDAVIAVGMYRGAFSYGAEDYDLWLRLLGRGGLDNLPDVHLKYRVHGASASNNTLLLLIMATELADLAHKRREMGMADPADEMAPLRGLDDLDAMQLSASERRQMELGVFARLAKRRGKLAAMDVEAADVLFHRLRNQPKLYGSYRFLRALGRYRRLQRI